MAGGGRFGLLLPALCVFKTKGYNIINAVMADRQVVVECLLLFLQAGHPPSASSQYTPFVVYTYTVCSKV